MQAEVRYLTTEEVAKICRAAPETVRYWRHIRKGPASFKLGRRVLYATDAVEAWLKAEQEAQNGGSAA